MKPLERRLATLEVARRGPDGAIADVVINLVSRNERGELESKPYMLRIPSDACHYLVRDDDTWPDDARALYDGR